SGCAAWRPWRASFTTFWTSLMSFFMALLLDPASGSLDRLLPHAVAGLPLVLAPRGIPRAVDLPVPAQLVQVAPEADGQAGAVGGAEGGGLADSRTDDLGAQDVGLQLHQEVVLGGAPVDL